MRYEARENAGEVVSTYNPSGMMENNISWKGHHKNLEVTRVEDEPLTDQFKYMFQKISDKSQGTIYIYIFVCCVFVMSISLLVLVSISSFYYSTQ